MENSCFLKSTWDLYLRKGQWILLEVLICTELKSKLKKIKVNSLDQDIYIILIIKHMFHFFILRKLSGIQMCFINTFE